MKSAKLELDADDGFSVTVSEETFNLVPVLVIMGLDLFNEERGLGVYEQDSRIVAGAIDLLLPRHGYYVASVQELRKVVRKISEPAGIPAEENELYFHVVDVEDWVPYECEHKWRDFGPQIGIVCRDCGIPEVEA